MVNDNQEPLELATNVQYDFTAPPKRVVESQFECPTCKVAFTQTVEFGVEGYPCPTCNTASPRKKARLIGKLSFNNFVKARSEYVEAAGGVQRTQWRLEFQAQDVIRSDGTNAIYSTSVNVTDKHGALLGAGSFVHSLGLFYENLGVHISPSDPRSGAYQDHYFLLERTTLSSGKGRRKYEQVVWKPIMYYGAQCPPITDRRVLEASDSDSSATTTTATPAVDDEQGAQAVAAMCDGLQKTAVFDAILDNDDISVKIPKLFGMPLLSNLAQSGGFTLINMLIEKGYLREEADGTLRKVA